MREREMLKRKINAFDFGIHELVLFLDTHPTNKRAMELLKEYRNQKNEAIANFEAKYGKYIVNTSDVPPSGCWQWLDSPWPWENKED